VFMKRSTEFNPDCQSYATLGPAILEAFSEARSLIENDLIDDANAKLADTIKGFTVKPYSSSLDPCADVNLRKGRFGELSLRALAYGKAGCLLERHDDRQAILYFNESINTWSSAWNELSCIRLEWELTFEDVVDEEFDHDFTFSYAFRVAEAYERLEEWKEVIAAVARFSILSGRLSIHEYGMLAWACDNLGDYDSCIEYLEKIRRYWYDEDNADEELRAICNMAFTAEVHRRFIEAIGFYNRFEEYYWRFESEAGRIEFNKACLWLLSNDMGKAYIAFHSARRHMLGQGDADLARCDKAIASLQSKIADGDTIAPIIESFETDEICLGTA